MPATHPLDTHWTATIRSPGARQALRQWATDLDLDPALDSFDVLVDHIRGGDPTETDRILGYLARRAGPHDPTAATVVVQALRPGLGGLLRRVCPHPAGQGDAHADLVTIAWETVVAYDPAGPARYVAPTLLARTRQRYLRWDHRNRPSAVTLDTPYDHPDPGPSPAALDRWAARRRLDAAVADGRITAATAHIVWRVHMGDATDDHVAAQLGVHPRSIRQRRHRALRHLAAA
ncbi:MAG: sigma-70 family RNA polymerase sigma factor [Actinobacteria bacterium]|nr:sigma-70 family RNA polymerase sigma factor [Actinomycetota bacterium]